MYIMPSGYSTLLEDPSRNSCYIYNFNSENWLESEPVYGPSGELYKIVYDSSMTYIGYGEGMSFFNASGEVLYLTGINSKANMDKIVLKMKKG